MGGGGKRKGEEENRYLLGSSERASEREREDGVQEKGVDRRQRLVKGPFKTGPPANSSYCVLCFRFTFASHTHTHTHTQKDRAPLCLSGGGQY